MTETQAVEMLAKLDTLIGLCEGFSLLLGAAAKTLTLVFGCVVYFELRRIWTQGSGLF